MSYKHTTIPTRLSFPFHYSVFFLLNQVLVTGTYPLPSLGNGSTSKPRNYLCTCETRNVVLLPSDTPKSHSRPTTNAVTLKDKRVTLLYDLVVDSHSSRSVHAPKFLSPLSFAIRRTSRPLT